MSQKTELQSNNTDLQTILSKVNGLPDQLVLPTLKNPAGAENIEAGFQALDGIGNVVEGDMPPPFKKFVGTATLANTFSVSWNNSILGQPSQTFPNADIQLGDMLYSPLYNVYAWYASSNYIKVMSAGTSGSFNVGKDTVFNVYR